ncbi:hypothetical protein MASR2M78_28700 [Treponema sp.]
MTKFSCGRLLLQEEIFLVHGDDLANDLDFASHIGGIASDADLLDELCDLLLSEESFPSSMTPD